MILTVRRRSFLPLMLFSLVLQATVCIAKPPQLQKDYPLPTEPTVSNASDHTGASRGDYIVWHPLSLSFSGPMAAETDDNPNPFLDYRLQVQFVGPSGQAYDVPCYFDGDARAVKQAISGQPTSHRMKPASGRIKPRCDTAPTSRSH